MSNRVLTYGLLVPLVALAAACDRAELSIAAPAPLSATGGIASSIGVQPTAVHPEFLPGTACIVNPAFGARLSIIVGGSHGIIVRGLRFTFQDRFGATALPQVIPIPSPSTIGLPATTFPSSSPGALPGVGSLPGASPIPIPGSTPIHGLFVSAGSSRSFPFFLQFDCGVLANGILVIVVDAADHTGKPSRSELQVRIGT